MRTNLSKNSALNRIFALKNIIKTNIMKMSITKLVCVMLGVAVSFSAFSADMLPDKYSKVAKDDFEKMAEAIKNYLSPTAAISVPITVDAVETDGKVVNVYFIKNLADYSFRRENLAEIYKIAEDNLPDKYKGRKLQLFTNGSKLEDLQSVYYSSTNLDENPVFGTKNLKKIKSTELKNLQKGRRNAGMRDKVKSLAAEGKLVENISRPYQITDGLQDKHIAMWQSHGWYYEQSLQRWEWQRARIFQTVEDIYTQSYVVPFLVPMLENSGAVVMLPRERDYRPEEIIVDNDPNAFDNAGELRGSGRYSETDGSRKWADGASEGFANSKVAYSYGENPFKMGKYRVVSGVKNSKTTKKEDLSTASWLPMTKDGGSYAVYVSYKTLPNSASDVYYTVKHAGGETKFKVNQKMGGGTWIYLGTFKFTKGSNTEGVYLSNLTNSSNTVITADAVKFGGGMGNMARKPADEGFVENVKSSESKSGQQERVAFSVEEEVSGYPRIREGARYWLQWAGFADTVYSHTQNLNDYNDDYMSRGKWVNAISGGSSRNSRHTGLNIPIDLSFAFHSDAGTFDNDSIVGTLSIYTRFSNDNDKFSTGLPRIANRELADLVQTQIVEDVRALHEPNWSRRGLWDRSYAESRIPEVPSMLLELLSHQNFADMRYGLDPEFRFTVSRAIYKGMVKFFSLQNNRKFTIQPLPVKNFGASLKDGKVVLTWSPVNDPLEPTAVPKRYVVYTRVADGDFDNGVVVNDSTYTASVETGVVTSYKVVAINEGGASFPSEILSVGKSTSPKGTVLIVNGFNRVSAPASFKSQDETVAGFNNMLDAGVPYLNDFSFIGAQHEYRREIPWMDDDAPGFGASFANYEDKVIAGNSFDYPAVHGAALLAMGYDFVSVSSGSVTSGKTLLNDYKYVDFIMGKQAKTKMGRGAMPAKYAVFPEALQSAIAGYMNSVNDGAIIVSGANVGRDLFDNVDVTEQDKKFATDILKYKFMTHYASTDGKVKSVANPYGFIGKYSFVTELNPQKYAVEAADAVVPAGDGAFTIFRYSENNISAGIAFKNQSNGSKGVVLGFPIESLTDTAQIEGLFKEAFGFFEK